MANAQDTVQEELLPFHIVPAGLDDPAEVLRSFEENGYMLFKGVLDKDLVLRVKADVIRELQLQGIVEPYTSQPVAKQGATAADVNDDPLYELSSYHDLMASPELQNAIDIAYGEKGYIAPSVGFRYSLPSDETYLTPSHQDHFFIRETDEFRMIWIPLMDLEIANGGLAIAAGSHKFGLIEHEELDDVLSYGFKGRKQKGVPPADIRGPWTASGFEVGDFLMFHSCAVHRSLPNTTNLIRLALNTLTYPARRPKLWQGERTIPQLRVYREKLKQLCDAEGINEALFEKMHIEGMRRGGDPTRELVLELAELLT